MNHPSIGARAQRGIVLVTSLLLLVVVTIIALSMFRSFGIQEKIAGNTREKQRALQSAISTQEYAENWLADNASLFAPVNCSLFLNARLSQGQICNNKLSDAVGDVTNVPWKINGAPVGVKFTPDGMNVNPINSAGTASLTNPSYYSDPAFYIAWLGPSADGQGDIYQVDAFAFGGTAGTAVVVESTYEVATLTTCRSCP